MLIALIMTVLSKFYLCPCVSSSSSGPPSGRGASTSSRQTRGVDYGLLPQPDQLLSEDGMRQEEFSVTCNLRVQQATVHVYAQFFVPDGDRKLYLVHRKALLRVTELVQSRMRIADTSVASLDGTVIEGLKPGRTEIQVNMRERSRKIDIINNAYKKTSQFWGILFEVLKLEYICVRSHMTKYQGHV